jgi:hypothetical protein
VTDKHESQRSFRRVIFMNNSGVLSRSQVQAHSTYRQTHSTYRLHADCATCRQAHSTYRPHADCGTCRQAHSTYRLHADCATCRQARSTYRLNADLPHAGRHAVPTACTLTVPHARRTLHGHADALPVCSTVNVKSTNTSDVISVDMIHAYRNSLTAA